MAQCPKRRMQRSIEKSSDFSNKSCLIRGGKDMKKKLFTMAMAVALIAVSIVGMSLAYFT